MLKRLFTSNTRIKLLTVFLMNEDQEFFIRELTRKLNEQINSVRRELDNLKKLGFLKAKTKNRKKYYHINKDFIFREELKNIIIKGLSSQKSIAKEVERLGDVKLLALSGVFLDQETVSVDMLVVGDLSREKLSEYLNSQIRTARPVKFSIISEDDYKYRINCNDRFITELINSPQTQIPIKKL